jgi:hypothetical protein
VRFGQPQAIQAAAGYDIGAAAKPRPTGQVREFQLVAKDGEPIRPELQYTINTLSIDAGEIYDIVFHADNPGTWVFHCHELRHTENDGVEPGGPIQIIEYKGAAPVKSDAILTPMPANMPGM